VNFDKLPSNGKYFDAASFEKPAFLLPHSALLTSKQDSSLIDHYEPGKETHVTAGWIFPTHSFDLLITRIDAYDNDRQLLGSAETLSFGICP
jgi:hypothetical protein